MKTKKHHTLWLISVFSLAILSCDRVEKTLYVSHNKEIVDTAISAPVEAELRRQIAKLDALVNHPTVVAAVLAASQQNALLSQSDIAALDRRWQRTSENDAFIQQHLTNEVALLLLMFQEENAGFVEIFLTDQIGLNVAQTNKTSDYYQADEDWWIQAYADGQGQAHHSAIEYDESSQAEAISLYVPIRSDDQRAIGVLKAVLDVTAIQQAFWDTP